MLDFSLSAASSNIDLSLVFDLVIIGAGPAGLTSAIYCSRYRLKTLLIEKKFVCGGQMATINSLENYPGFSEPVQGSRITKEMENQALEAGTQIIQVQVDSVNFSGVIKELTTSKGIVKSRAVIIATGAVPRMLGVPGEKDYIGKGVSYCATCDGHLYIDKTIAVVGGGNTALEEAITLTKYAKKIFLIHRRQGFRADKIIQEKIRTIPKIELVLDTIVKKINFKDTKNKKILIATKGKEKALEVDGIFIFVGTIPNSELITDALELENGFIKTGPDMKTNIEGVFAAGDIRLKSLRQVATAVGDGATAGYSANSYLTNKNV
ncbi:MAG: thioredoxin-disulfide reductase [Candidatus Omnitrophota bacterium]